MNRIVVQLNLEAEFETCLLVSHSPLSRTAAPSGSRPGTRSDQTERADSISLPENKLLLQAFRRNASTRVYPCVALYGEHEVTASRKGPSRPEFLSPYHTGDKKSSPLLGNLGFMLQRIIKEENQSNLPKVLQLTPR